MIAGEGLHGPKVRKVLLPEFYIKFIPMNWCNFCVSLLCLVWATFGVSLVFLVAVSAYFFNF